MSTKAKKSETVKNLTYYVVQTYTAVKGRKAGISSDGPIEARDREHALRLFERYKGIRAGVVAFHRTGSPATGEWEDAVIIARHGLVAPEVDAMIDESELPGDSWTLGESDLKVA